MDIATAGKTCNTPVIVNASAGAGRTIEWAAELTRKFRANGMDVDVTLAKTGIQTIETAQRAQAQGATIIVAGGGDGTINAVASVVAGTRIALGVLPLGTLNHFAKDLHIPLNLDEAIRTIANGRPLHVDVGEINDKIFLNNSSLGLYPDIVRERENLQRRLGRGKWSAFFWATLAALRRYPFVNARLTIDGSERVLLNSSCLAGVPCGFFTDVSSTYLPAASTGSCIGDCGGNQQVIPIHFDSSNTDVLIARYSGDDQQRPYRLLKNTCGGRFQELSQASFMPFPPSNDKTYGIVTGDIFGRHDGNSDLLILNEYGPRIYLNSP